MSSSKNKNKTENKTEKAIAAEKEQFHKEQLHSISKTITSSESPPKEKYVRNIIMGTHKEAGAATFWAYMLNVPLSSNAIVSWKFCFMVHKLLRDGHPNSVRDSNRHSRNVKDMGVLWGNLHDRYGHIVALSAKFLCNKMEFHAKHKTIPGNLEASDDTVEREAGNDVNKVFDMTQELLDYLDSGLKMAETVWRQLDANGAKCSTPAGQCRLAPLIPLILDCSFLYHFTVKLMFKLHSRVSPDSLLGHRERFRDLFNSLTRFFDRAREMEFFKKVIQIPDLPDAPPNFLRAAALAEYVKAVAVVPNQEPPEEEEAEPMPDYREAPQTQYYLLSQMGAPDSETEPRETEVESMRKELQAIKPELQLIKTEAHRCVSHLKAQVNCLEAELEEQRTHKQMALVDNEHLRMEVQALRSTNATNAGAQVGYKEADGRAQAAEIRFCQLKERHAELVTGHAELLKKNADTVRLLTNTHQSQDDLIRAKDQLTSQVEHLLQENRLRAEQQQQETDRLNRELMGQRAELARMQAALEGKEMAGSQMSGALAGLQGEREALLRSVREQEAELSSLRQQSMLQQSSLEQERDRSRRELGAMHAQLQQQACREGELTQKLQEEQFCLLQCAVVEAEGIILDAVAKLDDPIHVRCTSSPDYLVNRAEVTLGSIDKMQQSHMCYVGNMSDASGLLRAVTQFSHLAADTIVNGGATSHSVPTDQADCLTDSCRDCASHCLHFLKELKLQATLQRANPAATRCSVQRILSLGQELRPTGQDVLQAELGDMVDQEMAATSTAIEEAVLRMEEIMSQARRDTSGIKLEVNQSILGSCSDLMKAIHMLVTSATDLQKDIVEGGRGAESIKEFYAKNSRWTEGLISASKAVGWGATRMVDSADRVVTDKGKYEELIVCSHEIAASTAQLVAASKVKADRNNKKLHTLQQASRHVNDMAAVVVTSTKHGQQRFTDRGPMDFSGISRIKLKTEEMEAQVKVLELENQLEQERVRLGELRKKHYDLEGPATPPGEEGDADSFPPPPPPTLLTSSTPLPQAFTHMQPYLKTQPLHQTNPFSQPQTQSYALFQPQASTADESYSQPQAGTPIQSYSPAQSYSQPQSYTPTQSYSQPQAYSQSQPYLPTKPFSQTQPYAASNSQSYLQPQSFSRTPAKTPPQDPPNATPEQAKPAPEPAKRPSIFQKSGALLKSAFRRGEAGTGES
ncbi:huntingtin-interacting protein 1-related protein-like isoform X3 [Osmerus eperlanus]|uniref:huntingtin-interacting protein 1-related protein-like isoform X3 n=1 Tax=Osmerus eperlanus TaxID=29151 RepID=UPI002E0F7765